MTTVARVSHPFAQYLKLLGRGKKGSRNIIYMAAKGLDPTPASRHNTQPPPPPAPPAKS